MREIKFRAWDRKKQCWARELPFTVLTYADKEALFALSDEGIEWMQYTGLKDKNGKEIYEGDIVETETGNYEVAFGEGDFESYYGYYGVILKNSYEEKTDQYSASKWNIIGNVYENPELLK